MKKSLYLLFLILCALFNATGSLAAQPLSGSTAMQQEIMAPPDWQGVVEYARANLPCEGYLMAKAEGFIYVKVDDEYIHTLFPMLGLEEEGYKKPPYFRKSDSPGAHISVFYEDEGVNPEELGQVFAFELKQIVIVKPAKGTSYAVLQVDSPALEQLRQKYGLKPKLHGHEYHISLAKKTSGRKH